MTSKISEFLASMGHVGQGTGFTINQTSASQLVQFSTAWLIKNDFSTQSLIGRYIDSRFETLHTQINPLDFKDRATRDSLVRQIVGWTDGQQIRFDQDRIDESVLIVSMSCYLNSGPTSPGDVSMHVFRFYDVLRSVYGPDFESGGSLSGTDETPVSLLWIRYKYVSFIAKHLCGRVKTVSVDQAIFALFAMPFYQLVPCLVTAFRLFERSLVSTTTTFAYPVLDPRDWTESDLDFLLEDTRVSETPEWLKLSPLFEDVSELIRFPIGKALFPMPMSTDDAEAESAIVLTMRHYLPICSSVSFSIFDTYRGTLVDWFATAVGASDLALMEGYVDAFHVSMKGYFLAAEDLAVDRTLADIWRGTVLPNTVDVFAADFKNSASLRLSSAGSEGKTQLLISHFTSLLLQGEHDMFTPVLDLTSRRILLSAQIKKNETQLPLFYTFSSSGNFLYTDE